MKVKVSFTIEIDADAWELNYGTPRQDIREDVKNYAESAVIEQFAAVGVLEVNHTYDISRGA